MGEFLSLFLLTKTEKDLLAPIRLILADLRIQYSSTDLTDFSAETIDNLFNQEFARLCEERNIDTNAALNLSAILTKESWYSTRRAKRNKDGDLTGKDPNNPPWIYALSTSDNPGTETLITPPENLAFYRLHCDDYTRPQDQKIEKTNPHIFRYQEQISLNLPREYRYIDPDGLEALSTIREVFGGKNLPSIVSRRISSVDYPIDKPSRNIWNPRESAKHPDGHFIFAMEKTGSKKQVNVTFTINFENLGDDVKITRSLDPYDKAVYIAISALYNSGQTIVSPQMIYHAMGYTQNPAKSDLDKINQSITKMMGALIFLDNIEEITAGYEYPSFVDYNSSLLPAERWTGFINGGRTETAIHLFREPPMMTWARERRQITTISLQLLQAPLSKTPRNLALQDHLIWRIARAKNGKGKKKILYSDIYEKLGIQPTGEKDRNARKRIQKAAVDLLKHYKARGWISNYHTGGDWIRFDI